MDRQVRHVRKALKQNIDPLDHFNIYTFRKVWSLKNQYNIVGILCSQQEEAIYNSTF